MARWFLASKMGLVAATLASAGRPASNPFFVFDNGLHDPSLATLSAKLDLVKRVGFDGLSWRLDDAENFSPSPTAEAPRPRNDPGANLRGLLAGADQRGLKVYVLYCSLPIRDGRLVLDPELERAIGLCRGKGVMLWPTLTSGQIPPSSPAGDAIAVQGLRRLADAAAAGGVRIALYPHVGLWLQNVDDAVRVVRQVNRPNVGVTFNLCHALLDHEDDRIRQVIEEAAPYLFVATINGADGRIQGHDLKRAIQPLGRGDFDVGAVLEMLREVGFSGPIGLQCYHVEGDPAQVLAASFRAWKKLSANGR